MHLGLRSTLVVLAVAVTGCGGASHDRIALSGSVTLDSHDVRAGSLSLRPAGESSGPAAGGKIVNGAFAIPRASGPVPGRYTATIGVFGADDAPPQQASLRTLPRVKTFERTLEVTEDMPPITWRLTR